MFSVSVKKEGGTRPDVRLMWPSRVGDFSPVIQESPGIYRLHAAEIVQTGALVTTYLRLPKRHILRGIHVKHLNAARAESTAANALRLDKELRPDTWDNFFTDATCTNYDIMLPFAPVEVETAYYRIQNNTTAGHIIVVTFKVEALN